MTKKLTFLAIALYFATLTNSVLANEMSLGSDCNNPTIINALPYQMAGLTTEGAGDDYSTSPCGDNYIGGDDYVLTYTPASDEYVSIQLENVGNWTGLHLLDACPDVATNCIASDIQSDAGSRAIDNVLLRGQSTYYIIISTFPDPQFTTFDITVALGTPPPPGTDCSNAYQIASLPFSDFGQNTAAFGNDYSGTGPCQTENYLNSNEIIYTYLPNANEVVTLEVSNISAFFTGVQIMDACLDANPSCVATVVNEVSTDNLLLENLYLEQDQKYYIVISTWEDPQSTTYDLSISSERTCTEPTDFQVENITITSADLNWTGGAASYELDIVAEGSNPGATTIPLDSNVYHAIDLQSDTRYDAYLRAHCPTESLIITGVYDGPLSGGNPKGVELYVVNDIADLSVYAIGSANNGEGSDGVEFRFPEVAAAAGSFIYWASDEELFMDFFGVTANYIDTDALINGDDAVELFRDGAVVDVFGQIDIDGTGTNWEYKDGWAYRRSGQVPNNGLFDESKWAYSGVDQLEGNATNATCDIPFPIGSYNPPPPLYSAWAGPLSFTTRTDDPECGSKFYDNGGSLSDYMANSSDTITICPEEPGYEVLVKFDFFDVESDGTRCLDGLFIFDGANTDAAMITAPDGPTGSWCWDLSQSPPLGSGNLVEQTLISTDDSGCLTFVFKSNGTEQNDGWEASVSCQPRADCPSPTDLNASNITPSSAELTWTAIADEAVDAAISWGFKGVQAHEGTVVENVTNPYTLTDLVSSSAYDFYVKQGCDLFGNSNWTGPYSFFTACSSDLGDEIINPIEIIELPFSGFGSTVDCFSDRIGNASADAYYAFETGDCTYSIYISTCNEQTDFDTYIHLLDELGNTITANDDANAELCSNAIDGLNRLSIIEALVEPNSRYFVVVEGFGPNEGFFQLDIKESDLVPVTLSYESHPVRCFGDEDGLIRLQLDGGQEPYTVSWEHGATGTELEDLPAGTYTLTLTDACANSQVESIVVGTPDLLQFNASVTNLSESGQENGSIVLNTSGGQEPYTYQWSTGESTKNLADLAAGQYCVTVTDRVGCQQEECFEIEIGLVKVEHIDLMKKLEVLPNPAADHAFLNVEFDQPVNLEIMLINATGQLLDSYSEENVQQLAYRLEVRDYPNGIYFVQISYDNYSFSYKLVVNR